MRLATSLKALAAIALVGLTFGASAAPRHHRHRHHHRHHVIHHPIHHVVRR